MNSSAVLETSHSDTPGGDGDLPTIPPLVAQVLDMARQGATSLTPRELNAQLAQVLERYDVLTASFSENHARLREEMANLRQTGGLLAGQLQTVKADLLRQGNSLGVLAASTSADVQSVKQDLQCGLADVQERTTVQLETLSAEVARDLTRLGGGVHGLQQLFTEQERIVREQALRLDQFDAARELLDSAVRGNRKRIDEVRAELEANRKVVDAQVQGLTALHREHRAEFNSLQLMVDGLHVQSAQLQLALQALDERVSTHVVTTSRTFKLTHAGMALLLMLAMGGLAAVKWLPAFAPATMQQALSHTQADVERLDAKVAILPSLEFRATANEIEIGQLTRNLNALKQGVANLQQSVRRLGSQVSGVSSAAVDVPVLNEPTWVMVQPANGYTVQVAGVASLEEMVTLVRASNVAPQSLMHPFSYSITHPADKDRYNLFYGTFDSLEAAKTAMAELPSGLQANRPWIRQWQAIQSAAR